MAEEYSQLVLNVTQNSFIGLALALAKDVGILDALIKADRPLTSEDIAQGKDLKERYVREILGSLSGARIILVSTNENGANIYSLNEDQKRGLDMGFTTFHIGILGAVAHIFPRVKECVFKSGPYGFPYDLSFMLTMKKYVEPQCRHRLAKVLEINPDLDKKLERGIDLIEFGCGFGVDILQLARKYPNSRFTATDVTDAFREDFMTEWKDIPNLSFRVIDICHIEDKPDQLYDWAFCYDVIHDVPFPSTALKGIRRLVKPGGLLTFGEHSPTDSGAHPQEVGDQKVAGLHSIGTFICLREGLVSDDSIVLGPCVGRDTLRDLALEAGFNTCEYQILNELQTLFNCK